MRLFHYGKTPNPNFGDALNEWLWDRLLPGCFGGGDDTWFSGIGTIISARMPAARRWVVFSSGAGYDPPPKNFGGTGWTVLAVRGPLTARVLGLAPETAVADGALLLSTLPEFSPAAEGERRGVVFVPHHSVDDAALWTEICAAAGVEYLSPRVDGPSVIRRIRRAKLVLADAMHAAIVADAVRVPWTPVVSSPRISTFKWLDWTTSMGVAYRPSRLPAPSAGARVVDSMLWLSGDRHEAGAHDEAAAMAQFEAHRRAAQAGWWRQRRRLAKRVERNAARLLRAPGIAGALAPFDRARRERVAAALRRAAEAAPTLSDDRVFGAKVAALGERLDAVARIGRAG